MPHPISLYLHIPWCLKKCYYCDFNSHGASPQLVQAEERSYLDALIKDWRYEQRVHYGTALPPIASVFVGGGTPTILSRDALADLFAALCQDWGIAGGSDAPEITIEANPATTSLDKLKTLKRSGVNRISFGAQSFNPATLKRLGRTHGPEEITHSFLLAREAGFKKINLDIMYGLPQQTMAAALDVT